MDDAGPELDDRRARAATVTITAADPASPDAKRAASAYLRELDERFSTGFDPEQAAHDAEDFAGDRGEFYVVRSEDDVIGCGALRWLADGTAEIKRMWVDPAWRGLGIAARLLRRLEEGAVEHGHAVVRLDTNAELTAAVAMYRSAGYVEVSRYNDNPYAQHWFEKRLAPPAEVGSSS